jgi:hypothetical protein
MAIPMDWSIRFQNVNGNLNVAGDARAICPHCRNASTFTIRGQWLAANPTSTDIHLFLECNYGVCKKTVYVCTAVRKGLYEQRPDDPFFMYPSRAVSAPHPSVPLRSRMTGQKHRELCKLPPLKLLRSCFDECFTGY